MSHRLLIDECLSPELVQLAIDAGFFESTCVRDRGLLHRKDWELMAYVVAADFTLVTHNARDFRGMGAEKADAIITRNLRDVARAELMFPSLRVLTPEQCLEVFPCPH